MYPSSYYLLRFFHLREFTERSPSHPASKRTTGTRGRMARRSDIMQFAVAETIMSPARTVQDDKGAKVFFFPRNRL